MTEYRLRTPDEVLGLEEESLAPYASFARAAGSTRRHPEPDDHGSRDGRARRGHDARDGQDPRTPFQHDRDRVLHSVAFRRLQYKTQVYVFHEGDFYRTRLTHSIETAQIGRGLAQLLRVNEDLIEAVCLAHDVGHPPFGHAGETTLKELMAGQGGFEHNRQALRVVDELETRYPAFPGLNLTRDTREAIGRHATFYDEPEDIAEFGGWPSPGLEAQLAALADIIAYCTHDAEDALRTGVVTVEELREAVPLWAEAEALAARAGERLGDRPDGSRSLRSDEVRIRTAVRGLIRLLINDAATATLVAVTASGVASADDIRRLPEPVARFSPDLYEKVRVLKDFLYDRVYYDPRVLRMTRKGQMIIGRLWDSFTDPADGRAGTRLLPRRTQERLRQAREEGVPVERVVCDFIAGMTDRHAMDLYNILYQAYEPSLHSFS